MNDVGQADLGKGLFKQRFYLAVVERPEAVRPALLAFARLRRWPTHHRRRARRSPARQAGTPQNRRVMEASQRVRTRHRTRPDDRSGQFACQAPGRTYHHPSPRFTAPLREAPAP
ncbi:hypothetical protein GCM10009682_50170 [Luedemannella flava]|uniref:Uncharacterized protein n=1 Tax=Luedemannella flava TaxID=349316 RepID=A0ABN2MEX8_9ACTN